MGHRTFPPILSRDFLLWWFLCNPPPRPKFKKKWIKPHSNQWGYQICDKDLDLQKNLDWTKVKPHQINSTLQRRKDKRTKNKITNHRYFSLKHKHKHKPSPKAVPFFSCSIRKRGGICYLRILEGHKYYKGCKILTEITKQKKKIRTLGAWSLERQKRTITDACYACGYAKGSNFCLRYIKGVLLKLGYYYGCQKTFTVGWTSIFLVRII